MERRYLDRKILGGEHAYYLVVPRCAIGTHSCAVLVARNLKTARRSSKVCDGVFSFRGEANPLVPIGLDQLGNLAGWRFRADEQLHQIAQLKGRKWLL